MTELQQVDRPQGKPTITVVITDLDNTLFDWVGIWHNSFSAMLVRLELDSGIARPVLEAEFQAVFQKHGTSEYAFAIEELPSLQSLHPGDDLAERYAAAIDAYRSAREASLRLYPGVLETLECLKDKGCLLVGYTESLAFYSNYRVRKLGLDRVMDFLYSPPDHVLPQGTSVQDLRRYPSSHYELKRTIAGETPRGRLKPDPELLLDIIKKIGAIPEEVLFIGDSLFKDVAMAADAGVLSAWAKYGAAQDRPEYELLRRVTHWKRNTVEKERRITAADIRPSFVLNDSIGEVLTLCSFQRFMPGSEERLRQSVEIWKKTIDVQQHFNDLEMRIRNYAITLMVAVVGASGLSLKEHLTFQLAGRVFPLAAAFLFAGILGCIAFYAMDRFGYHRLLRGAVAQAASIEGRLKRYLPEMALTGTIGKHSPVRIFRWEIHSNRKIDFFYAAMCIMLLAILFSVLRTAPAADVGPDPPGAAATLGDQLAL